MSDWHDPARQDRRREDLDPAYDYDRGEYRRRDREPGRAYGERAFDRLRGGREGPHRGKGPQGYVRSDTRLREDVCDRLTEDALLDASEIEVAVGGGEVRLDGEVDTRMDMNRAEGLAWQAAGVTHVQNNLRLRAG